MSEQNNEEQENGRISNFAKRFNEQLASDISVSIFVALGFILIIGGAFIFAYQANLFAWELPIDSDRFSHFGDFAGGVIGTLWALIGILLIYKTLEFQKSEFQKLVTTADEQAKVLAEQQADNTFFNLLEHLQRLISDMDFPVTPKSSNLWKYRIRAETRQLITGHDCFREIRKEMERYLKAEGEKGRIDNCYIKLIDEHPSDMPHYFSFVYRIIQYVKDRNDHHVTLSDKLKEEVKNKEKTLKEARDVVETKYKKGHLEILRDQLSSHEIVLLFYFYVAHQKSVKDFKRVQEAYSEDLCEYLKEYNLFKNISVKMVPEKYRVYAQDYRKGDFTREFLDPV